VACCGCILPVTLGAGSFVAASIGAHRRVRRLSLAGDGILSVEYADGAKVFVAPSDGTRIIGRTVRLTWSHPAFGTCRPTAVWLTPLDVAAGRLRRLAVALRCPAGPLDL
jgi:hypothetical protein